MIDARKFLLDGSYRYVDVGLNGDAVVLLFVTVSKHICSNGSEHVVHGGDGCALLFSLRHGLLLRQGWCCCHHELLHVFGYAFFHHPCHLSHHCSAQRILIFHAPPILYYISINQLNMHCVVQCIFIFVLEKFWVSFYFCFVLLISEVCFVSSVGGWIYAKANMLKISKGHKIVFEKIFGVV